MPILASRLLGASLGFSGYRGAPIAAWVSPWSKPYASTDIKKKKKKKKKLLAKEPAKWPNGRGSTRATYSRKCVIPGLSQVLLTYASPD